MVTSIFFLFLKMLSDPSSIQAHDDGQNSSVVLPLPAIQGYRYRPPAARHFTCDEIGRGENRVNRLTRLNAIVEHPLGSIVEYPESGSTPRSCIGHRFSVDAASDMFSHPKLNIQYSLGDGHGCRSDVACGQLIDDHTGQPAFCKNEKISCRCHFIFFTTQCADGFPFSGRGLKLCEAFDPQVTSASWPTTPDEEVFLKTLAFFCMISDKGCAFDACSEDAENFSGIECHDSNSDDLESDTEYGNSNSRC